MRSDFIAQNQFEFSLPLPQNHFLRRLPSTYSHERIWRQRRNRRNFPKYRQHQKMCFPHTLPFRRLIPRSLLILKQKLLPIRSIQPPHNFPRRKWSNPRTTLTLSVIVRHITNFSQRIRRRHIIYTSPQQKFKAGINQSLVPEYAGRLVARKAGVTRDVQAAGGHAVWKRRSMHALTPF